MAALAGVGALFAKIAPIISGVATIAGGIMQAKPIQEQGEAQKQSALLQAKGQQEAADAQNRALRYQAEQLNIRAKEEQAAAQLESQQMRRERGFVQSALQARSAASGFSATDPTTLQIGSEIEKYGTLQEMMAAYGGRSRRAGVEAEAVGRQAEGASLVRGSQYAGEIAKYAGAGANSAAAGTILGSFASGFSRFASAPLFNRPTQFRYG